VAAPLVVIGLDGGTLDLVRPWAEEGRLPVLARLMAAGAWGPLRSTFPPATFPAWTSLVTGVNPGRHGLLDFTERVPGSYRLRFLNRTWRGVPALWTHLSGAGKRVAVVTVPGTYPPEPVNGVMVSGFESPLATAVDGSYVYPRELFAELERRVGRIPFADFQEISTGPGWHEHALARLLDGIARRTALARVLLARERWDAFMIVFGASDTVAHHFWRFHDPQSPRYVAGPFRDAVRRVYEALDGAIGEIVAAAPDGSTVAVVSDHGSGGAGDRAVHLNRRLAECGLLAFRSPGRSRVASLVRALALRALPAGLQAAIFRRTARAAGRLEAMHRFGRIDWRRTLAFSEEVDYHPSVWLNLRGREPEGTVDTGAYEATRAEIVDALAGWRDGAGQPVLRRVWRREELYAGPYVERAPDLLLELAPVDGYSPSCLRSAGPGPALRRLTPAEHGAGRGQGMSGSHRRDGMLVLAGPGVRSIGRLSGAEIVDMLPTFLALAGVPITGGLDGRPLGEVLAVTPQLVSGTLPLDPQPAEPFAERETEELLGRLAALGYLEVDG
jgi:predicted AlkP superfamily phosphohydrolase/phosphomutase